MSTADAERMSPGRPWPMGATVVPEGVNFAVFSAHAERIEICLFDDSGEHERERLVMPQRTGDVWHGCLRGEAAGLVYGLRAHGRWAPAEGQRFNPHKVLLDPWAREIVGPLVWQPGWLGHDPAQPERMDRQCNASVALKARVIDERMESRDAVLPDAPLTPLDDTVLYELHVRGFTQRHPGVPEALRGTYAGLASDAAIAHLRSLGVTAVSLLPVQQHLDEPRLAALGLSNYWGYNTIGFFCPEPSLAAAATPAAVRAEFRAMVRRLHDAGIEVILDVVYNHTAESDAHGPHLSWRGLDDRNWYRHAGDGPLHYDNLSGCGNALDLRQPAALQMVMDSLRHWVQAYGVDGFRFDLAPVLGRGDNGFQRQHPFFMALAQDPVLARVKLIAEPWDLGRGGYRLGDFPAGWLEWNDRFRDTMRAFWLGHPCTRGEFAQRLCGSADLFRARGRAPGEGVNYVVAHDGFTLADLVSYDQRHNQANGEQNRDGHGHNLSHNFGHEGPTLDAAIRQRRLRAQRALLACTVLAQGTPMLAAGAEMGHTQNGNNNAYCQDNPTNWLDWAQADPSLLAFTARLLEIRRRLRPLDGRWYEGAAHADGQAELSWLRADGEALNVSDWQCGSQRALTVLIAQPGLPGPPIALLVNANAHDERFKLPTGRWACLVDSAQLGSTPVPVMQHTFTVAGGSLALLRRVD